MSILKNQIIQEKLLQQSLHNPFTLVFHLNPITAKQLTLLKKALSSKNIQNSHKIIPFRFFHKLKLENDSKITSLSCKEFNGVVEESFLTHLKDLGGSSCVFFCSTQKELMDILEVIKESAVFLNLGIILNKKNTSGDGINKINFTFLSSYDIGVFLHTNLSIYNEFLGLLNKNTVILQSIEGINFMLAKHLQINQFHLLQILSLHASILQSSFEVK